MSIFSIACAMVAVNGGATSASGAASSGGSGVQFYVSPTGNDANPGTLALPWRTVQKSMTSATPGSTVNIEAGTYHERLTLQVSGTASAPIIFQPRGYTGLAADGTAGGASIANNGYKPCVGDQVILDYSTLGTVTDSIPFLNIVKKSYVTIQGLTFQNPTCNGSYQRGVYIDGGCQGIQLINNRFLHNQNVHGALDGKATLLHFYVLNATNTLVKGNELGYICSCSSETLTMTGGNGTNTNTVFESNYVHDTDSIGIDVNSGASGGIVRGNLLDHVSIKQNGAPYYKAGGSNAIYIDGGVNPIIERNLVRNGGFGIAALAEPGTQPSQGVVIRDNVFAGNVSDGIVLGTWYSNTDGSALQSATVTGNTLYGNDVGLYVRPYISSGGRIQNNLFSANRINFDNALNWPAGTIDYDLYDGTRNGPDQHAVVKPAQMINPSAGNYALQLTSPAINAGNPAFVAAAGETDFLGHPRVAGDRVDIGACESQ